MSSVGPAAGATAGVDPVSDGDSALLGDDSGVARVGARRLGRLVVVATAAGQDEGENAAAAARPMRGVTDFAFRGDEVIVAGHTMSRMCARPGLGSRLAGNERDAARAAHTRTCPPPHGAKGRHTMVLLADVGGISGVRSTLSSVKVPPDVINGIVAILETSPDDWRPTSCGPSRTPGSGRRGAVGTSARTPPRPTEARRTRSSRRWPASGHEAAMQDFDKEITGKDEDYEAAAMALLHRTELAVGQMDGDRHTRRPRPRPTQE